MFADFKFALRTLAKSPGFSAVAILTLALGIGANSAIFSVVEGTLLRPLPFAHSEQLVRLYEASDDKGARGSTLTLSELTLYRWREFGGDIFQGIAGANGVNVVVGAVADRPARNVQAARVTANFFSVLGITPALGRPFTAEEDRPGGPAITLVSDDFWRTELGGRPNIIGSSLTLDGIPHTIIGVMPKSFRHPYRANLWLPLALPPVSPQSGLGHYLYAPARLQPGVTPLQAEAALRRLCQKIQQEMPHPSNATGAYMPPLRESFVMDLRPKILIIIGAALSALLIAAVNFAGLLLARVVERQGEFTIRAALGASRGQIVRQQLVQALLLSTIGTVAGLLIAWWVTPALFGISPEGSDATGSAMREFDYAVRIDWPVFGFAAVAMVLIGVGFGLLPSARASRANLRNAPGMTGRGSTLDRGTRRLLGSLVVIEIALAAALLMAGITTTQYFRKIIEEPWGFATDRRFAFKTMLSDQLFADAATRGNAINATLEQLRVLPGVTAATVTSPAPMQAPRNLMSFNVDGASPPEPRGFFLSYLRAAAPGYFKTIAHSLLRGREFLDSDTADSLPVCVITEDLAQRFWPGQDAIGKRIKWGRIDSPRPWLTVVGVAAAMKVIVDPRDGEVIGTISRPVAQILPAGTGQLNEVTFVVQTSGSGAGPNEAALRSALARADSRLAAYEMMSLGEAAEQTRASERFIFVLLCLFSALGLILAAIGLYGLLSLQVARREREFGIRTALGATARQIIRLVAREGGSLFAGGSMLGIILTWAIVRVVRSQWSGLPTPNLLAWGSAGVVLLVAVLFACWLPARRAARVNPMIALRAE
ncbi:MAG TPA: ABC transporter permease [Chthoniobacterales bacterium]|nr:ABC transporter permease [Chthoniobacterales bacterium]